MKHFSNAILPEALLNCYLTMKHFWTSMKHFSTTILPWSTSQLSSTMKHFSTAILPWSTSQLPSYHEALLNCHLTWSISPLLSYLKRFSTAILPWSTSQLPFYHEARLNCYLTMKHFSTAILPCLLANKYSRIDCTDIETNLVTSCCPWKIVIIFFLKNSFLSHIDAYLI